MSAETGTQLFTERTIRQVRLDCGRAIARAQLCPERSAISRVQCVDHHAELDDSFGHQLWYFEGLGVDEHDRRHNIFGVIEYSVQFGLHELVEDGVFESEQQRERFRNEYEHEARRPTWNHPAHRWLAFGTAAIALACLAYLIMQKTA